MKPIETAAAYDQITERWEHSDFDRQNGISAHRRALTFSSQRGRALDVGCGCSGRFIDLFLTEGFEPEGLDLSKVMIEKASKRHPEVLFHWADICAWKPEKSYDFISAWDCLWHLPLDQHEVVLTKLIDALTPEGILIFTFGGVEQAGEHTNCVMGPEVYYSSLGLSGFVRLMLGLDCQLRHLEFDQYPEMHTYLIVQKNKGLR